MTDRCTACATSRARPESESSRARSVPLSLHRPACVPARGRERAFAGCGRVPRPADVPPTAARRGSFIHPQRVSMGQTLLEAIQNKYGAEAKTGTRARTAPCSRCWPAALAAPPSLTRFDRARHAHDAEEEEERYLLAHTSAGSLRVPVHFVGQDVRCPRPLCPPASLPIAKLPAPSALTADGRPLSLRRKLARASSSSPASCRHVRFARARGAGSVGVGLAAEKGARAAACEGRAPGPARGRNGPCGGAPQQHPA